MTAGINDTNWGHELADVVQGGGLGANPWYSQSNCSSDIAEWNFRSDQTIRNRMSLNVSFVLDGLLAASPSSRVYYLSYFDITASPKVPDSCFAPFKDAMNEMYATIQQGIGSRLGHSVRWIDEFWATPDPEDLQALYTQDVLATIHCGAGCSTTSPPGFPHPSSLGAARLADHIPDT